MQSLSDAKLNRLLLSEEHLLMSGVMYAFEESVIIANGGSNVISFSTGAFATAVNSLSFIAAGTRDLYVEIYMGGAVSGGTLIPEIFPRNMWRPRENPFLDNSVYVGRTVDVPGVLINEIRLGDRDRGTVGTGYGGLILSPDTLFYFLITNNEQTALITTGLIMSALL